MGSVYTALRPPNLIPEANLRDSIAAVGDGVPGDTPRGGGRLGARVHLSSRSPPGWSRKCAIPSAQPRTATDDDPIRPAPLGAAVPLGYPLRVLQRGLHVGNDALGIIRYPFIYTTASPASSHAQNECLESRDWASGFPFRVGVSLTEPLSASNTSCHYTIGLLGGVGMADLNTFRTFSGICSGIHVGVGKWGIKSASLLCPALSKSYPGFGMNSYQGLIWSSTRAHVFR